MNALSTSKRKILLLIGATPFWGITPAAYSSKSTTQASPAINLDCIKQLQAIESDVQGRLGISALNTENGQLLEYRADERFPMASTSKFIIASAILHKSISEPDLLDKHIAYTEQDLVPWSPITEKQIKQGMSIEDLCYASMTLSDNTAANLLMRILGGPQAVTAYARSIGDYAFNLTRWEPDLNSAIPGDIRDTTTPAAMMMSLKRLALENTLLPNIQRLKLLYWLKMCATANDSTRAALPPRWIAGNKTGGGAYGTTNDIAFFCPPEQKPWAVALYFTQKDKDAKARKDVLVQATHIIINSLL